MPNPFNNLTATRLLGVGDTFFAAKDAFNTKNWGALVNYLDPNVVVYNISNVAYKRGVMRL